MDRDAMVLYLRDVRDLEVARRRIRLTVDKGDKQTSARVARLQQDDYEDYEIVGVNPCSGGFEYLALAFVVVSFSVVYVVLFLSEYDGAWYAAVEFAVVLFFASPLLIMFFNKQSKSTSWERKRRREVEEHNREVDEHNRNVDASRPARLREAARLQENWRVRRAELKSQHKKANELLGELYDMNILAAPYRDLVHVAYIYEYMSTSQASLEDALLHEHMEDGFNRMERKLDEVVAAVDRNTAEICRLRAENNAAQLRRDKADRALLESLQRNEANTAEAARYARLNADHSNTLAFFATVNYLEK